MYIPATVKCQCGKRIRLDLSMTFCPECKEVRIFHKHHCMICGYGGDWS